MHRQLLASNSAARVEDSCSTPHRCRSAGLTSRTAPFGHSLWSPNARGETKDLDHLGYLVVGHDSAGLNKTAPLAGGREQRREGTSLAPAQDQKGADVDATRTAPVPMTTRKQARPAWCSSSNPTLQCCPDVLLMQLGIAERGANVAVTQDTLDDLYSLTLGDQLTATRMAELVRGVARCTCPVE